LATGNAVLKMTSYTFELKTLHYSNRWNT